MKSLIVDDDASCRDTLLKFLAAYGECQGVADGQAAVDAVRDARDNYHRYDLVCMDILMPGMDGQTAIREIRRAEVEAGIYSRRVKIIMTTGMAEGESVKKAFAGKCDAYLLKPIDTTRLLDEMKKLGLVR
jgi:two-component system chemotaxis response regulator CheY